MTDELKKLAGIIIKTKGGYREKNILRYVTEYNITQWDREHKVVRLTANIGSCEVDIQSGKITG